MVHTVINTWINVLCFAEFLLCPLGLLLKKNCFEVEVVIPFLFSFS